MWDGEDAADAEDGNQADGSDQSTESLTEAETEAEANETDETGAAFAALLSSLRALPGPCAPPIGEGAFDILYASAREIVVWFISARDGVAQREVAIPARLARQAWELLRGGAPVDEAALRAIAAGAAGARWLLALFAQLPGMEVTETPTAASDAEQVVALRWRGATSGDGQQPTPGSNGEQP